MGSQWRKAGRKNFIVLNQKVQDLSCYVRKLSNDRTDILLPLAKIRPEASTKEDRIVHDNGEILVIQDTRFRTSRKLYYLFHLQKDDFF